MSAPLEGYRYLLWREWDAALGTVCWVMLNPSTADDERDDPTVRKCVGFSKRWGYGAIEVVNLWAMRATFPRELRAAVMHRRNLGTGAVDPTGGLANQEVMVGAIQRAQLIVAAWGAHANAIDPDRPGAFHRIIERERRAAVCLGTTKDGSPRHPSRVGYSTPRVAWRAT